MGGLGCWFSITVSNLVQKWWSTSKLWPKTKFKMAAAAILNFISGGYLWHTADCPLLISTIPHKISCQYHNRRLTYGNFSKFKMAAIRHLGIEVWSYKTAHEASVVGHISLSNFMSIRLIVLKIWGFEFFLHLAWNAYSRPHNFVFGGKIWENLPLGEKWPLRKLTATKTRHVFWCIERQATIIFQGEYSSN